LLKKVQNAIDTYLELKKASDVFSQYSSDEEDQESQVDEQIQEIAMLVEANSIINPIYWQVYEIRTHLPSPGIAPAHSTLKPVYVQLIHSTVTDQLSLILLPDFVQKGHSFLERLIEVKLDAELAEKVAQWDLL
jgi:hypothetical protein